MDTFCVLVSVLGEDILMFLPMVLPIPSYFSLCVNSLAFTMQINQVLSKRQIQHGKYQILVNRLLKNEPLASPKSEDSGSRILRRKSKRTTLAKTESPPPPKKPTQSGKFEEKRAREGKDPNSVHRRGFTWRRRGRGRRTDHTGGRSQFAEMLGL